MCRLTVLKKSQLLQLSLSLVISQFLDAQKRHGSSEYISLILGSIFSGSIIVRFDFYLVLTSSSKEKTCHVVLAVDSANTSLKKSQG